MANRILINRSGMNIPVYSPKDHTKKIGTIYSGELYSAIDDFNSAGRYQTVAFNTVHDFTWGVIYPEWAKASSIMTPAFSDKFSSGWKKYYGVTNSVWPMQGFIFPIRRTCLIYNNTKLYTYVNAGDAVMLPAGNSRSGTRYPGRIEITCYRKKGVWYKVPTMSGNAGWIDIGLSSGISMKNKVMVYSAKW